LQLKVRNVESGKTETLESTYTADAQYFGGKDDVASRIKRPKMPFAPLAIAGPRAYAGTILFYTAEGRAPTDLGTLIGPGSRVEMTLSLVSAEPSDWLDQLFAAPPAPISLKGKVDDFLVGALYAGDTARIRLAHPAELQLQD
jgi:hypothetical protein